MPPNFTEPTYANVDISECGKLFVYLLFLNHCSWFFVDIAVIKELVSLSDDK